MIDMVDRFKQTIRQSCQLVRKKLSFDYQRKVSAMVCDNIRKLEEYRYAKRIALYQSVNGEIDLGNLWRSAPLQGKYCYFPTLNEDNTLCFLPATPASTFQTNRFGIDEPHIDRELALAPDQLDLILTPLLAFDQKGTRVGMGAGYYDRTLASCRPKILAGVAYEFQRQSFIETQAWDVPLDMVITESNIYWKNS